MSDYATFEPQAYLDEYYGSIPPDTHDLLSFMVTTFQQVPAPARVLDFGGGPTLYAAIVAAARAGEIHLSDYAAANREAVTAWLRDEPGAFAWGSFVAAVLDLEGHAATPAAVREREAAVRTLVTRVLPCDAALALPIAPHPDDGGRAPAYDLLCTNLCLEAAAGDAVTWRQYLHNVAALVRPGGYIMMATVRHARAYPVGARLFPIAYLDEVDIAAALRDAGFDPASLQIAVVPSDHPLHPYAGLILASAIKAR